jgi:hypothetical protein
VNLIVALALVGFLPTAVETPVNVTCNADLVCLKTYKNPHVRLVLESYTHKPLSVRLFFTTDNMIHVRPPTVHLDKPTSIELVSFVQPVGPWGYEYRTHYGHEKHDHDDDYVYTLPYKPGKSFPIAQSHQNLSTHRLGNRYAIDWAMPVGEPVYAARGGRVVSTYDDSDGPKTGNHIWIQHSDGTIGKYLHLAHKGVRVEEDDEVRAGQFIGKSGDTGFTKGPHLHFSVSTLGGRYLYQTFNVQFLTDKGVRQLVGGETYTRPAKRD